MADQSLRQGTQYELTDIPGLRSRVDHPFEFLGLYKTHKQACKRHNIPAIKISGDANEEQTLTALQANLDRTDVLTNVLNDLYHLFRYDKCDNVTAALVLLLEAMDRHLYEKLIQISGRCVLPNNFSGSIKELKCSYINLLLHLLFFFFFCSAILFYIAKLVAKKPFLKTKMKRHLISTLINAMGAFQDDETVFRNACLTLIQFNVPNDMVSHYD